MKCNTSIHPTGIDVGMYDIKGPNYQKSIFNILEYGNFAEIFYVKLIVRYLILVETAKKRNVSY